MVLKLNNKIKPKHIIGPEKMEISKKFERYKYPLTYTTSTNTKAANKKLESDTGNKLYVHSSTLSSEETVDIGEL